MASAWSGDCCGELPAWASQKRANVCGMTKAPRLLLLVNESEYFLSHRANVARAAVADGFEVHVVTRLTHQPWEIQRHGVHVHHVEFPRAIRNPVVELRTVARLRSLYRAIQPDVVHHFSAKAVLLGSLAARSLKLPHVVNTFTGLGSAFCGSGLRAMALRVTASCCIRQLLKPLSWRVTFQNQEDLRQLVAAGLVRTSACELIRGSGVDPAVYRPASEPVGPPTVMLASRMIRPKGVGEFVEAARLLRQTDIDARFVLVGDSDPQNPHAVPASQLRQWDREGVVQWWGRCRHMPEAIRRASVIVLPTYYGEGLPKILLEAAACGKPIVTTDVRGCRDIVRNGTNGLLVPPRDVQSLTSAMWRLIDQPALRQRMGRAGRALVLREFTAQQVADKTVAIYRTMLGLPRTARAAGELQRAA